MTRHDPFIMLPHAVYDSQAFASLKPIDIAVLLLLIRKHNGHNNGAISLGVREAARRCRCSQATAYRALARLQNNGLITATYKGHLVPEIGRPDIATRWQLNFVKDSAHMGAIPKRRGCFPNETSGCFSGETSLGPPVRFSGETPLGASLVKQSKDYLTAEAEAEAMPATMDGPVPVAAASPRRLSRRRVPVALPVGQTIRGKPNGFDRARK